MADEIIAIVSMMNNEYSHSKFIILIPYFKLICNNAVEIDKLYIWTKNNIDFKYFADILITVIKHEKCLFNDLFYEKFITDDETSSNDTVSICSDDCFSCDE